MQPVANPPNPWSSTEVEYLEGAPEARLEVFEDHTRTILATNDSPDLGFRWSVNPYRGCFHGCAYCYARPSHEYLSFGAGTDFERKIVVKPQAPALLREALDRPSWKGEVIVFSGVTDCYQPLEASYRLTRGCLEVCAEYRNPVGIITKAPLVERDIDVLTELARVAHATIHVSVPLWDRDKARAMEPYVATPQRRMRTVERLAAAGLEVGVNVCPMIPGLGDEDIPAILRAARDAGAVRASCGFLRLPGSVKEVFEQRLREALPLRAEKVMARIREARGGKVNDARFGVRQQGEGVYADQVRALFESTAKRLGLRGVDDADPRPGSEREGEGAAEGKPTFETTFQRPEKPKRQLELFK
jgi:DNA repair photolyase